MYEDRKHRVSGLLGGWRGRLVRGSALLAAALCLYHLSALAAISTSVTISNNIIRALAYDARLSWQQKGEADWTVLTNDNGNGEISGQISVTFASPNRRSMPIPSPARAPMQETV
ncbi:MAG: hypothetical protein LBC26_06210 [Oscillospiraceae bacterium]|jgi:hypothetical protein|nr:hypothetical protein [Oscillospiraceae bacterium]